ncbi:thiamine pyrophosphate-binding protein [Sphingosinicella rhizophila]|uniref:Thiamine pyrophosphate-binding protein n=1 Tax=Sphingosinicella rhizophila TaxID=3050082 RepID=A0ABU3Q4B1_9SPHN|nr:thiamine pyrophosphate-binding protein [Sphingosinicella sp. GR2756]MDT9598260.1 thiamine pyrophosphate-binding protein [Sphingosinicella sp. GR2756]
MTSSQDNSEAGPPTVSRAIARFISSQGVKRVYTLPGSHVKPICSELDLAGVRIISARDERSAVHMAHADADLTGILGVAIVTAGPGMTNAITSIASAFLARTPLLVLSARVPDPQAGMGALEEVPQADLVRPVSRHVREISDARHVLQGLHLAVSSAMGNDGPAGPAYVDFAPNLLKMRIADWHLRQNWFEPVKRSVRAPGQDSIDGAARLLRQSRRPLVIGGRGALGSGDLLERFLEASGSLYLDTRESRGALSPDNANSVPAQRGRAMAEADLIITLGRRLDFELAFGSPAIFSEGARFLRIGRNIEELSENRPGDVQLCADVDAALRALLKSDFKATDPDRGWREGLIATNAEKSRATSEKMANLPVEADGRMHPLTLIGHINRHVDEDTICIVDGGDILSHARVGLRAYRYLDLGPFGCLGSGVPYAIAASLAFPEDRTVAIVGDGAFGFSAIEIETAVRCGARALFIVANNDAWNIERQDQLIKYADQELGSTLSPCRYDLLARSLGAHGERVDREGDLAGALERGLANLPAVIDVAVTRNAISSDTRSGLANVPPLHAVQAWDDAERAMMDGPAAAPQ